MKNNKALLIIGGCIFLLIMHFVNNPEAIKSTGLYFVTHPEVNNTAEPVETGEILDKAVEMFDEAGADVNGEQAATRETAKLGLLLLKQTGDSVDSMEEITDDVTEIVELVTKKIGYDMQNGVKYSDYQKSFYEAVDRALETPHMQNTVIGTNELEKLPSEREATATSEEKEETI